MRRAPVLPGRVGFLVAAELLDRFGLPGGADGRTLALDDHKRKAVDKHDDVGDDVLLRPEHPVLPGDDPLVAIGVIEVEEPDRVALAAVAAILLLNRLVATRQSTTRGCSARGCDQAPLQSAVAPGDAGGDSGPAFPAA